MMPRRLFVQRYVLNNSVRRKLNSCSRIILLLDFDGTLAPIRKTPSLVSLPSRTRALLRRLSSRPDITVGLVTGRSRSDIMKKVGMSRIVLITNHGFQISRGQSRWVHPAAIQAQPVLREIARKFKRALKSVPYVLVEDKRHTLTLHYRNVQEQFVPFVKKIAACLLRPYEKDVRTTRGKKVLEIRPNVLWNKGHAVRRVLKSLGLTKSSLVVYIGDDRTDEDAFKLLHGRALTVLVGRRTQSAARYRVRNPRAVTQFLKIIDATTMKGERG